MRALRFLGMGMGVASQGHPARPPGHPAPPRQLRAQDLQRYAFASGEGTA